MTKFNADDKKDLTYGDCLDPAMKITEQEDADQYLKDYIAYIQTHLDKEKGPHKNTAEEIAKINLGYYAGYGSNDLCKRVEKLFRCSHPIFGKAEEGIPTAKEAFELGRKMGAKAK